MTLQRASGDLFRAKHLTNKTRYYRIYFQRKFFSKENILRRPTRVPLLSTNHFHRSDFYVFYTSISEVDFDVVSLQILLPDLTPQTVLLSR